MEVIANGEPVALPDGARLTDLLARPRPGREVGGGRAQRAAVDRADMAATALADGDRIELVRAVAGG